MNARLMSLLRAREERAWLQSFFLRDFGVVVQISLNIPGYPKRLSGDSAALCKGEALFLTSVEKAASVRASLSNAAGLARFAVWRDVSSRAIKERAVAVEEGSPWCRLLDIDVISRDGNVGRSSLGLRPRLCLLCEEEAKVCSRLGAHSVEALRSEAESLLRGFL